MRVFVKVVISCWELLGLLGVGTRFLDLGEGLLGGAIEKGCRELVMGWFDFSCEDCKDGKYALRVFL